MLRPKILENHWLFKFKFMDGYAGITIGHLILFRGEATERLLKHELAHVQQILQLMHIVGGPSMFYVKYLLEFIWNMLKYGFDWKQAYWNISFEVEARDAEET